MHGLFFLIFSFKSVFTEVLLKGNLLLHARLIHRWMYPKMYGLNRLRSAHRLRSLFTAAAAPSPRRLLRLSPPIRPFAFPQTSSRCVVDHPPPASPTGIDDIVKIGGNESAAGGCDGANERNELPPELLSDNVMMLTCESDATAESRQEVEAIVRFLKPQAGFVELCSSRRDAFKLKEYKELTVKQVLHCLLIKRRSPLSVLYHWKTAKVAKEVRVVPGAEFRAAYEEANKYGGKIILGDRSIQITLRRIRAKMTLRNITKHIYYGLVNRSYLPEDLVKKMKGGNRLNNADLVSLTETRNKWFPYLVGPLVHEGDQCMSAKLLEVARKHESVVAVVGRGHLTGIHKYWEQPIDLEELLQVPAKK